MENMQSQSFGQADYPGAAQPQLNTSFVDGSPDDVFGYALGGPATAPSITEPRPFWAMDMNTSGMAIDVDLSATGADLFQTNATQNAQQRWTNQVFQQTGLAVQPQQGQQQHQQPSHPQSQGQERLQSSARRDRPIAPKTAAMSTPSFGQTTPNQNFTFESFQMSMDDPFATSPGGVDPGLLFGQPVSSAALDNGLISMTTMPLTAAPPRPTSSAPANMGQSTAGMGPGSTFSSVPMGASHSQQRRFSERSSKAISPAKDGGNRPSLSRSLSENARGGKRTVGGGRNTLPTLAPAKPATVHQPSLPPNPNSRSQLPNGSRPSGRTSPLKPSHHQRLSSLTSIPENVANFPSRSSLRASAQRTSVKFVIDENGRARAETVRDDSADEDLDYYDAPEPLFPSLNASHHSWGGSVLLPTAGHQATAVSDGEDYSSSEDDEPIIIPHRNTSYSYPEPPRSSGAGGTSSRPPTASSVLSHNRSRQRSFSDRPSTSSSSFRRAPHHPYPDDAEENMMEVDYARPPRSQGSSSGGRPSTGGSLGDAAAELRKVMQGVNPRRIGSNHPNPQQLLLGSNGPSRQKLTPGQRSSSSTISEASLPPAGASPTQMDQIRCVCNRPEAEVDGVQFLIKWYVLLIQRFFSYSLSTYFWFCLGRDLTVPLGLC